MEEREFEWDEAKNAANIRKHGIAFEEAVYAFLDPIHAELYDWNHSVCTEERWLIYGLVSRVLVVSFTEKNGKTRIISARRATPAEKEAYYHGCYSTIDLTRGR